MTVAHWSPNLSVGVEALDADHKALIDLLNELGAEVDAGATYETIAERLDALIARTEAHFRREEEIMAREAYPEAEYHGRIHAALLQEVRDFRADLDTGMEIGPEITGFIKTWLISHIQESDQHLGGYLEGRISE